jgi:hypothetical protein
LMLASPTWSPASTRPYGVLATRNPK